MSRCYGYPPPGYSRKSSSINEIDNEALILSIKLQRENEKAISDREREKVRSISDKQKKREKKERKKHKEKEKSRQAADSLVKEKQVVNLYESDMHRTLPESKFSSSKIECEQVEKSSVTEEHGQAIDLQKASCSSDSTGNSSKRKRSFTPPCTPTNSIQSHGSGNILRIRLSSMKTEDQASTSGFDVESTSVPLHKTKSFPNFEPCSSILREEPSGKQKGVKLTLDTDNKLARLSHETAPPLVLAPPAPPPAALVVAPKEDKLSSHEKKILKREAKYKKLFGGWVPPSIQDELVMDDDDKDEDWLFGNRGGDEKPAKTLKRNDLDMNGGEILVVPRALQPRASYLCDVGIYAMPFTLPF